MAKSKHFYIRRAHRYLGVILGIQFLCWTLGGLYFSWSNMDEIHGDLLRKNPPLIPATAKLVSPSAAIDSIKKVHNIDSVVSLTLVHILGKPYYQVSGMQAMHHKPGHEMHMKPVIRLADAETGLLRGPLTREEAIRVATEQFTGSTALESVSYLTQTNGHHEYRENALPAFAVTFSHPSQTTVYVSAELGTVQKFRNNKWRVFDFLWMLHTMDYEGRDNISNWLLRIFSIFGLVTVSSGFLLFFISRKRRKRVGVNRQ